jgi:hypothetical protein
MISTRRRRRSILFSPSFLAGAASFFADSSAWFASFLASDFSDLGISDEAPLLLSVT